MINFDGLCHRAVHRGLLKVQSNLAIRNGLIRNKLVLGNHFPWPICHLLDKVKELLALRKNFRANKKFLIAKFDLLYFLRLCPIFVGTTPCQFTKYSNILEANFVPHSLKIHNHHFHSFYFHWVTDWYFVKKVHRDKITPQERISTHFSLISNL